MRRAVVTVLALVAAVSCGSSRAPGGGAATTAAGPSLLAYAGPTVSDGTLDLRRYADGPVAFWFWAPG